MADPLLKATTNFPTRSYVPVVVISFLCSPLQQNLRKDLLLFPNKFLSSNSLWNPLQTPIQPALIKVTSAIRFARLKGKLWVLISPNPWTTSVLFTTLSFSKSLLFLTLGLLSYVCSLLPCWMCSLSPFLVPPHLPVLMWACRDPGLHTVLYSVYPHPPWSLDHGFKLYVCDSQFLSPAWPSPLNPRCVCADIPSCMSHRQLNAKDQFLGKTGQRNVQRTHENAVSKIQTMTIRQMTQFLKKKIKKN